MSKVPEPYDDDLYSDLNTSSVALKDSIYRKKNDELQLRVKELENEAAKLQESHASILKERDNLLVNIKTLYETAKSELKRKDKIISRLRQGIE